MLILLQIFMHNNYLRVFNNFILHFHNFFILVAYSTFVESRVLHKTILSTVDQQPSGVQKFSTHSECTLECAFVCFHELSKFLKNTLKYFEFCLK